MRGTNLSRNKRGITLVALVITIIVLLILAGITINLTIGENGIITIAQQAGKNYVQASTDEQSDISDFVQETEAVININTDTGSWDNVGKVNTPELLDGMTAIKFNAPVVAKEDEKTSLDSIIVTTNSSDTKWYNYEAKQWANAQTKDGSMWVWIPRFAYIVDSSTQTFKIVFLIGTTDYYYKEDGTLGKAQRATADNLYPDTTGSVYTVHPAFTNESSINYANGGWDSELTGIWVAKFEAGLPDNSADSSDTVQLSSIGTDLYYPVFKGQRYSYNYITISNAFLLSQEIAKNKEVYGLNSTSTDSHLMKNSEWGAVAYLSKSKYGLNTTNIVVNNVNYNGIKTTIRNTNACAVTGYAGATTNSDEVDVANANVGENTLTDTSALGDTVTGEDKTSYAWYTNIGISASSTGTIYGIYDLSGGAWERTASFVNNGNGNLTNANGTAVGEEVYAQRNTKYVMVYEKGETGNEAGDDENAKANNASRANYTANKDKKIGDAVKETVTSECDGANSRSWYNDYSRFPSGSGPFVRRGGSWNCGGDAGLFAFYRTNGGSYYYDGFRPVLVKQ